MAAFISVVVGPPPSELTQTRMPPSNKQTLGVSVYMAIFVLGR